MKLKENKLAAIRSMTQILDPKDFMYSMCDIISTASDFEKLNKPSALLDSGKDNIKEDIQDAIDFGLVEAIEDRLKDLNQIQIENELYEIYISMYNVTTFDNVNDDDMLTNIKWLFEEIDAIDRELLFLDQESFFQKTNRAAYIKELLFDPIAERRKNSSSLLHSLSPSDMTFDLKDISMTSIIGVEGNLPSASPSISSVISTVTESSDTTLPDPETDGRHSEAEDDELMVGGNYKTYYYMMRHIIHDFDKALKEFLKLLTELSDSNDIEIVNIVSHTNFLKKVFGKMDGYYLEKKDTDGSIGYDISLFMQGVKRVENVLHRVQCDCFIRSYTHDQIIKKYDKETNYYKRACFDVMPGDSKQKILLTEMARQHGAYLKTINNFYRKFSREAGENRLFGFSDMLKVDKYQKVLDEQLYLKEELGETVGTRAIYDLIVFRVVQRIYRRDVEYIKYGLAYQIPKRFNLRFYDLLTDYKCLRKDIKTIMKQLDHLGKLDIRARDIAKRRKPSFMYNTYIDPPLKESKKCDCQVPPKIMSRETVLTKSALGYGMKRVLYSMKTKNPPMVMAKKTESTRKAILKGAKLGSF